MHQKRREWEKKQKKFKNVANYNVPVLFASSDGLTLRLVDDNYGPEGKLQSSLDLRDILFRKSSLILNLESLYEVSL